MYAPVAPSNPDQNEQSVFSPKMPKNSTFWGVHIYMGLYKGVPPPPVLTIFMVVRDRDQV